MADSAEQRQAVRQASRQIWPEGRGRTRQSRGRQCAKQAGRSASLGGRRPEGRGASRGQRQAGRRGEPRED
ncbi:hypothetical protein TIFTF001_048750 [Ficus carica]|uniref:Uncharacterized protein n=1 Tax=Ficus carica TaxID=3494 RepID=A0AA87YS05_FICCA|nr:hypothetical protein TIFTF001_048744 [Ficus carica]GMN20425.1 hypothetical protein TIFTF001_048746 [Ficus carica]GMN20435.1 hypothetical protein TIFTF001_048748 [Ficus carica]GMN20444.1 hypothetical protein TIFTF001_048750 [Ficus carica]